LFKYRAVGTNHVSLNYRGCAIAFAKDHPTVRAGKVTDDLWRWIVLPRSTRPTLPAVLGIWLFASSREQALTVTGQLLPEPMRDFAAPPTIDTDTFDGRLVLGGITEPYPGCWPEAAVYTARSGDLTSLWPYLAGTASEGV